ncbi:MAG TPA: TetR family transcriptional regulator [Rhodothermales bacterium]|nr:TetR family transcriptional regulator [Rhodothermales bacterium]
MPPQEADTEGRIFEAALRVFAAKGFHGARMQEIADAAGINKALLHYYFRSKEGLYGEVFRYVFGMFVQSLGTALRAQTDGSFAVTLRTFVDGYLDFLGAHPDVPRLLVGEMLAGGAFARQHIGAIVSEGGPAEQLMFSRIRQAVERGEIRPVDPRHLVLTVIGACVFPLIARPMASMLIPEIETDFPAYLQQRKDEVFYLLYEGLARR